MLPKLASNGSYATSAQRVPGRRDEHRTPHFFDAAGQVDLPRHLTAIRQSSEQALWRGGADSILTPMPVAFDVRRASLAPPPGLLTERGAR